MRTCVDNTTKINERKAKGRTSWCAVRIFLLFLFFCLRRSHTHTDSRVIYVIKNSIFPAEAMLVDLQLPGPAPKSLNSVEIYASVVPPARTI